MNDKKEAILEKINQLNCHDFRICDHLGGSAFRDWYMLYQHHGVFIGFHNHNPCALFSSDPTATDWRRGYNNSCGYGDPQPVSESAKLVPFYDLPDAGKEVALRWVEEAIEICKEKIRKYKEAEAQKNAANEQKKLADKIKLTEKWSVQSDR
jgi:hypothetical protein